MLKRPKPEEEALRDVGRSVWKRPKRKYSEWKEPYEMLNEAKPLSNNNSWAEEGQRRSPKMNQSNRKGALWKPLWEEVIKVLTTTTKPLRRRVLIEEGLAKSSKKQHLENTDKWQLCKAGSFSYSESSWTPPTEELHSAGETIVWRDSGGSWACLWLCVKSPCHRLWHVKSTLWGNTRKC